MAIAKVILNGVTQMDVTQKTVTAGSMLSGTTALKNDGTDITGTIASKSSADLTASGATVTAPAGYYASAASKSVASGSAGTPTASKGTVSNHSVSVTPSVTNSTGYITGGTKTGTAVTVSASELVSGTKTISASGTTDVTNYESVSVASGSAKTPNTTITANPTVSVNSSGLITASVSKTQSVTPTVSAGYVASGTAGTITVSGSGTNQLTTQAAQTIHPSTTDQTIASGKYLTGAQTVKAVTTTNLSAENIVSGVTVKVGDSTDDDCVASVTGTAETGGNDFIITLTKNASTGVWEPDCTYAEAQAAYDGGKNVAFEASLDGMPLPCGEYSRTSNNIQYSVFELVSTSNGDVFNHIGYVWDSLGINAQNPYPYYDTTNATATPEDVANGKIFYNADGYQVGTASGRDIPTLLHSENVEISYSSTSRGSVATLNVGAEAFGNHIVYIKIRDTAGKRENYFYGSDTYIYSMGAINNLPSVTIATQRIYTGWLGASSTQITPSRTTDLSGGDVYYGIYGYNVTSEGVVTLYALYSSNYSGTINSTYKVDVYLLPYPGGTFA